jgi:thiamine pyrophosphokinase
VEQDFVCTFLVAGSPDGRPPDRLAPGPADRVIAVDRGAAHAHAWGWPVHLLIGDLDSLPEVVAAELAERGIPTLTAPAAKDETDLELALAQALAEGARQIVICAALGGRADHLLANVLLLARPELAGLDVMIADGNQTIRLLRGTATLQTRRVSPGLARPGRGQNPSGLVSQLTLSGAPGDLLSLLPVGGDAVGITTTGLVYPLRDETLHLGQARGVSNVLAGTEACITLRAGLLLVMHVTG